MSPLSTFRVFSRWRAVFVAGAVACAVQALQAQDMFDQARSHFRVQVAPSAPAVSAGSAPRTAAYSAACATAPCAQGTSTRVTPSGVRTRSVTDSMRPNLEGNSKTENSDVKSVGGRWSACAYGKGRVLSQLASGLVFMRLVTK